MHSVSGTGIGTPRQRTQLTPRGSSSSHGIFPVGNQERNDKDDVESSSTFLTDMAGHSEKGPQTARGPSAPGLPPLSARGPGMHTARVPGAKAERPPPKKKDNKMAAAAMYLAINADKTVNRNRAANVGWTAQDFRPSFANVREEIPRRRLSQTYALDSVQLASACLTLHTSTTPQDVASEIADPIFWSLRERMSFHVNEHSSSFQHVRLMTASRPFARYAQPNNLAGRLSIFSG